MRYLALIAGLLLPWPGAQADSPVPPAYYQGEINADNNRRLLASLQGKRIRTLVIDSPGGDVSAGIALGRWIYHNGINVEVAGQCLSSCANYVFPAGRHKRIRDGAVVAWHGNYHHLQATGLWSDDVESRMSRTGEDRDTATTRVAQQVATLVRQERDFFDLVGVDQRLCWDAKLPPYAVPYYFTLGVPDMERYGVRAVSAPANYLDSDFSVFDVDIVPVRLDLVAH